MRGTLRRLALVIALVVAFGRTPAVVTDAVQHEHTASLAIRDGQLCLILQHSDGHHESAGVSLHAADHELQLLDQHATVASVHPGPSDHQPIGFATGPVFVDASSATRAILWRAESPPTVWDARSTILRI